MTGSQVPALAGLRHTVRPYTTPAALVAEFKTISRGLDLYLPLLLAGLLALLTEGWLANQPPRKTGPGRDGSPSRPPAEDNTVRSAARPDPRQES